MRPKHALMLASVFAGLAGAAALGLRAWPAAGSPHQMRTVLVIGGGGSPAVPEVAQRLCRASAPCLNGAGGIDVTVLLAGVAPRGPTQAIVLTDRNCMTDAYGISHCRNTLRLQGGQTITVRHDHDMQRYPCLTSGETVRVVDTNTT